MRFYLKMIIFSIADLERIIFAFVAICNTHTRNKAIEIGLSFSHWTSFIEMQGNNLFVDFVRYLKFVCFVHFCSVFFFVQKIVIWLFRRCIHSLRMSPAWSLTLVGPRQLTRWCSCVHACVYCAFTYVLNMLQSFN